VGDFRLLIYNMSKIFSIPMVNRLAPIMPQIELEYPHKKDRDGQLEGRGGEYAVPFLKI
jgi:hypothetical protein